MIIKRTSGIVKPTSGFTPSPDRSAFAKQRAEAIQKRIDNVGKGAQFGDRDYYIKPRYKLYKMRAGDNFFRFAPCLADPNFIFDILIYRNIGPDQGSYLSPAAMKLGIDDPIAELHQEALALDSSHPHKEKLMKMTKTTQRMLAQGWDKHKEPQSANILILDAPYSVGDGVSLLSRDPESGTPFDLSDKEEGRTVIWQKITGGGKFAGADGKMVDKVEYKGFMLGRNTIPLSPEQLKEEVPFRELLMMPDPKVLRKIADFLRAKYLGGDYEQTEEVTEEETGAEEAPELRQGVEPFDVKDKPKFKVKVKRR